MTHRAEQANPVLVEATRSGRVESVHRGTVVLLDPDGKPRPFGDASAPIYPRSSLKPLQATAMVRAGLDLEPRLLAVVAASHDGSDAHVKAVRGVLSTAGIDEDRLLCPPDLPYARDALEGYLAAGGRRARVRHNCSGKHAGMLVTCAVNGWPLESYPDPDHPLQKHIRATVEDLTGDDVDHVGVDGCGAPVPLLTLPGLARAFRTIATAGGRAERRVAEAVRAHPDMVGGPRRPVTELMAATPGLLAKEGAEGVWAAALPDGRAVAVKLDDGGMRALPAVLAAVLEAWHLPSDTTRRWTADPLLGGGRPVGALRPAPALREWLDETA